LICQTVFHTKPKEYEENPDKIGFNREPLNPEPDNLSSYHISIEGAYGF